MSELISIIGVTALLCLIGIFSVLGILTLISQWVIYTKAGQPGWAVLVPIYATFVHLRVIRRPAQWGWVILGTSTVQFFLSLYEQFALSADAREPTWAFVLSILLSLVLMVYGIRMTHGIARVFGKTTVFTLGLLFLPYIFYPILAFGNAPYQPNGMVYNSFGPG